MDKKANALEMISVLSGRVIALEMAIKHLVMASADPVTTAARLAEYLNQQQGAGENTPVDDWVLVGFQKSAEQMIPRLGDTKEASKP